MLKNYFKVALRNITNHKLFSFINVIGLSIGISAALVIYLIVQHDLSFDKFHPNGGRIYRVVTNMTYQEHQNYNSGVSRPLPQAVMQEVPGIEKGAKYFKYDEFNISISRGKEVAKFKQVGNVVFTENQFFSLFKYKWLAGSEETVLNEPNKVVLTQQQAALYFPHLKPEEILNRIINYDSIKVAVAGIVSNFKDNTDITFHDFISYKTVNQLNDVNLRHREGNWGGTNSAFQFMVQLNDKTNPVNIGNKITGIYQAHDPKRSKDIILNYKLQPLADIHFDANYANVGDNDTASKTTLYGLLVIASFLLLLGCINFINLVTAQSSQRAKEIGIRKTIGGTRQQLIIQLLTETFLITFIAVLISITCTPLILKLFADFISPNVKFDLLHHLNIIVFLIALTLVVSLLSGLYPAMILSGYKPIQVLKSQSAISSGTTKSVWLRKSLTVTQFVIAQFFIMATILVSKQIYYAEHKNLGFKKDAIIYLSTPWKNNSDEKIRYFANTIATLPHVLMTSQGGDAPAADGFASTGADYKDGKKEIKAELSLKFGDANYIKLYGIKLLAGRNIQPTDTNRAFVVNETYAHLIGFKNAADAVNKIVDNFNGDKRMQIVGVVSDFQQSSLHDQLQPLAILWHPKRGPNTMVHVALARETPGGHEWEEAITNIRKQWKLTYPEDDFKYQFVDESIKKLYINEEHTSQLLIWSSGLSILISCLGLLGLAMYTTRTRTKEIGVRKVLGATVAQIVALLSREIVLLIVLAFIIVTPVAYWAMHVWIQDFADRTSISWWIFALSGLGMLLTAMLTSTSQTFRAATANPVKSLRSE